MSDPVRIALVAEGPTDGIIIEACLSSILGGRRFVLSQLQPEGSLVFGSLGGGWTGVYQWCKQAMARGRGRLRNDRLVLDNFDILILHVDADVAGKTYRSGNLAAMPSDLDLPCERPCPPPADTTDALRKVLLGWCGEIAVPAKTVICMPSKSTEAWVMAALFPGDREMARRGFECHPDPESRLGQQRKPIRIRKCRSDYQRCAQRVQAAWRKFATATALGEALRFGQEVRDQLPAGQGN